MKHKKPHVCAWMVVTLYCIAVIFAHLPTFFPPHGALDGVAVVLLTLPWISLVIDVLDALDPEIIGHPLWGNLAVLICAAINASVLFFTTYWVARFLGNRKAGAAEKVNREDDLWE